MMPRALYRGNDRYGGLGDPMLSQTRNMTGTALRVFGQGQMVNGQIPERVMIHSQTCLPQVIRETLGKEVDYYCNQYLNN